MSQQNYEKFFEDFRKIVKKVESDKEKGKNDYNPLTVIRNPHEEVGLHSRFIASLLDPQGLHYQKSRFLKLFLEAIDLKGFEFDADTAWVRREHNNIDIYITDGEKHIIIENKVYAREQDRQIERYIKTIRSENSDVKGENIYVLYLSLDKKDPSPWSTGIYTIKDNKLEADGYSVSYKAIKYGGEIRAWIESSKKDIEPSCFLKNIYHSLCWYQDVIDMLEKNYKGVMVELSNHLKEKENYKVALEIVAELTKVRREICKDFFTSSDLEKALREVFPEEEGWTVQIEQEWLERKWGSPIKMYKREWAENRRNYFFFGFEFERDDYYSGGFGITKSDESMSMDDVRNKLEKELQGISNKHKNFEHKNRDWWLVFEWLPSSEPDGDFAKEIQLNDFTHEKFKERIARLKKEWEGLLDVANKL